MEVFSITHYVQSVGGGTEILIEGKTDKTFHQLEIIDLETYMDVQKIKINLSSSSSISSSKFPAVRYSIQHIIGKNNI